MKQPHPLKPKIGVGALSSPLEVGADRAPGAAQQLAQALTAAGCDVIELGHIGTPAAATQAGRRLAEAHVAAVALAATSWFEDYLVLDLLEECGVPVLFWPLPGMETGALCGTQQTTATLRALDQPFASVFGPLTDPGCAARALVFLHGAALRHRLRRTRIGLAGHHVNGMTHTVPNELLLKKILGPRVVWLDLPQLLARADNLSVAEAQPQWETVRRQAGTCEVADADGLDSVRIFLALREVVREHGLHALGIGCYPHLMGRVCLAASLLADEGVPMACEGDPHGALGQYALQLLTGEPTHNTDWLDPLDESSVVFSHCGSGSWSLAERPADVRLASVRLMGRGVCTLFTARPGPVTLLNITPGPDHYKLAVLEGEAVSTTMVFPGNPVQVRFGVPVSPLIDWIHETGLGHHWMIGYGLVSAEIRAWARLAGPGLQLVEVSPARWARRRCQFANWPTRTWRRSSPRRGKRGGRSRRFCPRRIQPVSWADLPWQRRTSFRRSAARICVAPLPQRRPTIPAAPTSNGWATTPSARCFLRLKATAENHDPSEPASDNISSRLNELSQHAEGVCSRGATAQMLVAKSADDPNRKLPVRAKDFLFCAATQTAVLRCKTRRHWLGRWRTDAAPMSPLRAVVARGHIASSRPPIRGAFALHPVGLREWPAGCMAGCAPSRWSAPRLHR